MDLATTTSSGNTDTLRRDGEVDVRALIVDDEEALRTTLARVLRQQGVIAETAENGFAALDMLERSSFDVVLVDVRMPGMTGPQFVQRVKAARHPVEVLMMTAFADIAATLSAVNAGAHGFLTKPFASDELVVLEVLNAARLRRLRERTEHLQRELSMDALVETLGLAGMGYPEAKRRILAEFNDSYVRTLLASTSGNMSEAARRSSLDRSNFRRLVRTTSIHVGSSSASAPSSSGDDET